MLKYLLKSFYFPGFVFFLQLLCCNAYSQNGMVASFEKTFNSYTDKVLQEKIFIHTDKDFYVAGELLWFKVYYTDASSHRPLELSKVVYIEILNSNGNAELQAKISLESGGGNGSFYLPVTLNSGNYTLRAYTSWMKNFDPAYFFEKKITIVNTLRNSDLPIQKDSAIVNIDFFPEGGNLVSDIQSKIGFRVTDQSGKGLDFSAVIVNETGDTVTQFSPYKFGIGNFIFKPLSGHTYRAVILLKNGITINKSLPVIYNSGYVLKLDDKGTNDFRIAIYRKGLPGEQNAAPVLLAAHTRQVLHMAEERVTRNNDSAIILIDKSKIADGVTHFTLFNANGKPVCERLYFKKPATDIILNINGNNDNYSARQKVNLSISAEFLTGTKADLSLSASVYSMDSLEQSDQADIVSYMWLTSDLAGNVESPAFYFTNEPGVDLAVDNLMLTHGWRRFKWDNVMTGQPGFIKFLPEYNGHLINGKVIDTRNNKSVSGISSFLTVPGHPYIFNVVKSDTAGNVQFEIKNYYGNGDIISRQGFESDTFSKVEIKNPFAEGFKQTNNYPFVFNEEAKERLTNRSRDMQVQNIYSGEKLKNIYAPVIPDTIPFYGNPEVTYKLDDYKRFTTMEEVLREYVKEINVGVKNGQLTFKMFSPSLHDFYDGNVLVLLDGVPLSNPDKIFIYDPLKIKKLDIIQSRYVVGPFLFNGIASFSTYDGIFNGHSLDTKLLSIDYDGLQLQREFYSPAYETKEQIESRIPDFRNTLFWSPGISIAKDEKTIIGFYTSDRPGKYKVVLQGMSANGNFVSTHTLFIVK